MTPSKLAELFEKADDVDLWAENNGVGFKYTLTPEDRAAVAAALRAQARLDA